MTTKLTADVNPGDTVLEVESTSGFEKGNGVEIDEGSSQEDDSIASIGSLVLTSARATESGEIVLTSGVKFHHAAGASVTIKGSAPTPPPPTLPPGPTPKPKPTPKPTPAPSKSYKCTSDTTYTGLARMEDKGIVLDDTSFLNCTDEMFGMWPNTNENMKLIRSYAPWRSFWPGGYDNEAERTKRIDTFVTFVKSNNMKVFMGQDVTCNETDDDFQWELNKKLIKQLGKEHIAAMAIGNEMDFLWNHADWWKEAFPDCMQKLWVGKRYWNQFQKYVKEMDAAVGSSDIPVTSVWTAGFSVANNPPDEPPFFQEIADKGTVRTFVTDAHNTYGKRWIWTFNPYPIWSQNLQPDPGNPHECNMAIMATKTTIPAAMVVQVRKAVTYLTHNDDEKIWGGEIGWSNPISDGMENIPGSLPIKCPNYTSLQTFAGYYEHFLKWDMSLKEAPKAVDRNLKGLDKAFFFTMRDAGNGAAHEHFGLVPKCGDTKCKIQGLKQQKELVV